MYGFIKRKKTVLQNNIWRWLCCSIVFISLTHMACPDVANFTKLAEVNRLATTAVVIHPSPVVNYSMYMCYHYVCNNTDSETDTDKVIYQ